MLLPLKTKSRHSVLLTGTVHTIAVLPRIFVGLSWAMRVVGTFGGRVLAKSTRTEAD